MKKQTAREIVDMLIPCLKDSINFNVKALERDIEAYAAQKEAEMRDRCAKRILNMDIGSEIERRINNGTDVLWCAPFYLQPGFSWVGYLVDEIMALPLSSEEEKK